tara:strand:- start:267 stop:434 length:168 start_codon:yes stop_codon:yes gene_type:complete
MDLTFGEECPFDESILDADDPNLHEWIREWARDGNYVVENLRAVKLHEEERKEDA